MRCITFDNDGHPVALARENASLQTPFVLAIHFEGLAHAATNGNGVRCEPERRGRPRRSLAVPIRVRPEPVPWFEEALSLDFSPRGMRFRSHREYAEGEWLRIAVEDACSTAWPSGEFRARVVRVCSAADGVALRHRRLPRNLTGCRAPR